MPATQAFRAEAAHRRAQLVVDVLGIEVPPQAIRVEHGGMAAGTLHLHTAPKCRVFEHRCDDSASIAAPFHSPGSYQNIVRAALSGLMEPHHPRTTWTAARPTDRPRGRQVSRTAKESSIYLFANVGRLAIGKIDLFVMRIPVTSANKRTCRCYVIRRKRPPFDAIDSGCRTRRG